MLPVESPLKLGWLRDPPNSPPIHIYNRMADFSVESGLNRLPGYHNTPQRDTKGKIYSLYS